MNRGHISLAEDTQDWYPLAAMRDCVKALVSCVLLLPAIAACGSHNTALTLPTHERFDSALGTGTTASQVLIEPRDGYRPLVRMINKAQTTIFVEVYILTDKRIVHALQRAEAEGVSVYVMLEPQPFGMGRQPQQQRDMLEASGIATRWTRPGFLLTHAKFMVFDDRIMLISTANFSRSAFSHNREFLVVDHVRRDVRQISNIFRADWDRISPIIDDANLLVSPVNARTKLLQLLKRARHSVDIYSEEFADAPLERVLARAARKISIRIILPKNASAPAVSYFRRHRVPVRELQKPYIHAKALIVDDRLAYVGSENFSTTSLDGNREVGILLQGDVVSQLAKLFTSDWRRAG
jgi:cardiolipin synthase A/B